MVGFGTCSTQYGLKYKKVHFREASKSKMNILKTKFRIDWSRTLVALMKKFQKTLILAFEASLNCTFFANFSPLLCSKQKIGTE